MAVKCKFCSLAADETIVFASRIQGLMVPINVCRMCYEDYQMRTEDFSLLKKVSPTSEAEGL